MLNNSTHYPYCFQYWNLYSMALNKSNTNPDFGLTSSKLWVSNNTLFDLFISILEK